MKYTTYILLVLFVWSACSSPETTTEETNDVVKEEVTKEKTRVKYPSVTVNLEPLSNSEMSGTVKFVDNGNEVHMKAKFDKVTQGKHAIHFHEFGDCSAADGSSAGGHWNPTNEDHGKWGVPPFHRGDIGNFEADANGSAEMYMETDLWCIGCGDSVKDILGKSIIIHAGEDDCTSQPSGNAGARIACGVAELDK